MLGRPPANDGEGSGWLWLAPLARRGGRVVGGPARTGPESRLHPPPEPRGLISIGVSALGRLAPDGEVIKIAPAAGRTGAESIGCWSMSVTG